MHRLTESAGAGHPGEEDIGGLVLVSNPSTLKDAWLMSFLACSRSSGTEHSLYRVRGYCRRSGFSSRFSAGRSSEFMSSVHAHYKFLNHFLRVPTWVRDSRLLVPDYVQMKSPQVHVSCVPLKGDFGLLQTNLFTNSSLSPIHQAIKEKMVASTEQDTTHIFRTLHNTARVFKNKVAKEVVAIEKRPGGAKFEDVRDLVSGARGRKVYELGDPDFGIWTAGIAMGLIKDIPTCEELLARMEREAEEVIEGLHKTVVIRKERAKL